MDFMVTQMTSNRAYSKARRRLHENFDQLKRIFTGMRLDGEPFDMILVSFVDEPSDLYREIRNNDRVYHVELGIPQMNSYSPENDPRLLITIADHLRKVLEASPASDRNKKELLKRFSEWESNIRKQSLRVIKGHTPQ